MISNYKCTYSLKEGKSTSVTQEQMPSQREQYGGTVHLFIGAGHSPCKITLMPFTFGNNSIVIHRGLNSLFIFKSVSFSAITPKLSCSHLRRCINLRILWASVVVPIRVRRYLFTHYTPETLLNHVFEDLRKPKAPNSAPAAGEALLINVAATTQVVSAAIVVERRERGMHCPSRGQSTSSVRYCLKPRSATHKFRSCCTR
jgi:hypothetical protein